MNHEKSKNLEGSEKFDFQVFISGLSTTLPRCGTPVLGSEAEVRTEESLLTLPLEIILPIMSSVRWKREVQ